MAQNKEPVTVYRVNHPLVSKTFDSYYEMCEEVVKVSRREAEARLEVEIWMLAYGISKTIFDTVEEITVEH